MQSPLLPTTPFSSDEGAPEIGRILVLMDPLLVLPITWDNQVVLLLEAVPGEGRNCSLLSSVGSASRPGKKLV